MIVVTTYERARREVPKPFRVIQIGRGTPLGNPFKAGETEASRTFAIQAYKHRLQGVLQGTILRPDFSRALTFLQHLVENGENLVLVCPGACRPELPCHGDVLKEHLDQFVTGDSR